MEAFLWIAGLLFVWLLVIIAQARRSKRRPIRATLVPALTTTYAVAVRDGHPTITCLRCDMTSWHPKDVENLYCGNCHEFHKLSA